MDCIVLIDLHDEDNIYCAAQYCKSCGVIWNSGTRIEEPDDLLRVIDYVYSRYCALYIDYSVVTYKELSEFDFKVMCEGETYRTKNKTYEIIYPRTISQAEPCDITFEDLYAI